MTVAVLECVIQKKPGLLLLPYLATGELVSLFAYECVVALVKLHDKVMGIGVPRGLLNVPLAVLKKNKNGWRSAATLPVPL